MTREESRALRDLRRRQRERRRERRERDREEKRRQRELQRDERNAARRERVEVRASIAARHERELAEFDLGSAENSVRAEAEFEGELAEFRNNLDRGA